MKINEESKMHLFYHIEELLMKVYGYNICLSLLK